MKTLFKRQGLGIRDNIYNVLSKIYQRVILKETFSGWVPIKAGVDKGSILGSLLLLIDINDIFLALPSSMKM